MTCKNIINVKETTKYQFGKTEQHPRSNNKPKRNEDGKGWRRLTWIGSA